MHKGGNKAGSPFRKAQLTNVVLKTAINVTNEKSSKLNVYMIHRSSNSVSAANSTTDNMISAKFQRGHPQRGRQMEMV